MVGEFRDQYMGDHPLGRQASHLHPQVQRLVVAVQDRGPQPTLLEPQTTVGLGLGDEVPGELGI